MLSHKLKGVTSTTSLFYIFIGLSLVIALVSSYFLIGENIRSSTVEFQQRSNELQSDFSSRALGTYLDERVQLLQDLSQQPILVNAVMGTLASHDNLIDYFDDYRIFGKVEQLYLLNILGEPVYKTTTLPLEAQLDEKPWFQKMIEGHTSSVILGYKGEKGWHFTLAVPVKYNGLSEGIILVRFQDSLNELVPSLLSYSAIHIKGEHFELYSRDDLLNYRQIDSRSIGKTGLTADYYIDDQQLVYEVNHVLERAYLGITGSLLLAFIFLFLLGKKFFVDPFKALELSERDLREQQERNHEQGNALKQSNHEVKKALEDLEQRQFALDQHAIVAITDVKGIITYANDKFCDSSGYSQEELIGQHHRIVNSDMHDDAFFKTMNETITKGKVWHGEVCNKAKNGGLYWVDNTIVPFMDSNNKPESYISIRTDITENKEREVALAKARDDANQAAKTKSEFLACMSHEIRTPMNGVLGMLGLLLNEPLSEQQRHKAATAQSSAKSLLALINDILDFSKIDAGKLELEILEFDLRKELGEFAESMALQTQNKHLELVLDVTKIEQSKVKGDPGRIRQILTNIVGNAIKFTNEGEIVIRAGLKPAEGNKHTFSCSIKDTGVGIPKDRQATLFEAFTQADASTTRKFGGTGLGLSIVKQLCELMGGSIKFSSEEKQGACFEFTLTLQSCDQSRQVVPKIDMSKLKLLVVDDNKTNREVLTGQLIHWGANVTQAKDGPSAINILQQCIEQTQPLFDVAFLDMQMPDMDGAMLSKVIKSDQRFASIKLVMMTSMSDRGDAKFFADLGFNAYFSKPATTSDLFDALAVVIEGGVALQQAKPLVTHHYLQSLESRHLETEFESEQESQTIEKADDTSWPANTRLLLAEDNPINQIVAQGVLEAIGLSADIAADGKETLAALKNAPNEHPYTLVIMDCQMPEMDGYETSQNIRSGNAGLYNKSIPIIAMTANAMKGDKEKCLEAGMSDYLCKPIDPVLLKAMMKKWIKKNNNGL